MNGVNTVTTAIDNGINKLSNMLSLGDDRGGFALTGTGVASNPLPGVSGQVDDNSLVDLDAGILDVASFRGIGELVSAADNGGDLRDATEGAGIGVWAPKETTTIENVVTENGSHVSLEVNHVNNVYEHGNLDYVDVELPSGKDSTVQVSKTEIK